MPGIERGRPNLDDYIAEQMVEAQKVRDEGNPGRQRKLRDGILSHWMDILAIKQIRVPSAIKEITKDKLSDVATITLWMSPSPWTEPTQEEQKKESLILFVEKQQAKMWRKGYKDAVINYFQMITENKQMTDHPPRVPREIRAITKDKMTESALFTFWVLPSPWLWRCDNGDYKLDTQRSPSGMWKDAKKGFRDLVTDYMKVLADNLDAPLHSF